MSMLREVRAAHIGRTGDDTPASGLYRFVWRMSGRRQFLAVLLAALVAVLSIAPLEIKRLIIDEAIKGFEPDELVILGGLFIGVVLLQGGLKFAQRLYQGWMSESAIRYCRRHLAELRDKGGGHGGDGAAISVMGAEIDQVGGFVGDALAEPVALGGVLLAISSYMLFVEPLVAAVALTFLLPQILLAPLVQRKVNRLVQRRIGLIRGLTGQVAGSDGHLVTEDYETQLEQIYRNRMGFFAWKFFGKAVLNFLNWLGPIAALTFGGWMVIQGRTELGVVVSFMSGMERMSGPLRDLIAYYRRAAQTRVKHDAIAEWIQPPARRGKRAA